MRPSSRYRAGPCRHQARTYALPGREEAPLTAMERRQNLRRYARAIGFRVLDGVDVLTRREKPSLPPRRLRHLAGGGDYQVVSRHLTELMRMVGGLSPTARVLDVGSGTGRVALGLTRYLSDGTYDGIEIVRPAVQWCQRVFSREHPNFCFHHLDVRNGLYNPKGGIEPTEVEFPFAADSFDFAILTSVFTHLTRATVDRYLAEVARVLALGGRAAATFFLLNAESLARLDRGEGTIRLIYVLDDTGAMVADPNVPEFAIGHPEDEILANVKKYGFEVIGPVHYGTWCGRASGQTYQDLLVLQRQAAHEPA